MFSDFLQFSSGVQVAENKMTRLFDMEHFSEETKKHNLTKIYGSDNLFYFLEHFSEETKKQNLTKFHGFDNLFYFRTFF